MKYKNGRTIISRLGYYNTPEWRRIRNLKISNNPICEICEKENKITQADVIDHIIPLNESNVADKLLEYSNLMSLCNLHHYEKTHKIKTKYSKIDEGKKLLTDLNNF